MACFVGLMRGEILPDRCNQCPPLVGTSMSTDPATAAAMPTWAL
jgi:hypothetical protein